MPKGKKGTSSITQSVSNVSNTGVREVSRQTTGSTGAVTNTINQTTTQGGSGAPGTTSVSTPWATASVTGTPGTVPPVVPPIDIPTIVAPHITQAQAMADGDLEAGLSRAEGHLAQVRQQVLGQVPTEYRDRVNAHFDTAASTINTFRRRRRPTPGGPSMPGTNY